MKKINMFMICLLFVAGLLFSSVSLGEIAKTTSKLSIKLAIQIIDRVQSIEDELEELEDLIDELDSDDPEIEAITDELQKLGNKIKNYKGKLTVGPIKTMLCTRSCENDYINCLNSASNSTAQNMCTTNYVVCLQHCSAQDIIDNW